MSLSFLQFRDWNPKKLSCVVNLEQETSLLSYYALTSCNQKLKLMRKGGQFTYTSTLTLTCSSRRAQTWNRSQLKFILINKSHPPGFKLKTSGFDTILNYYIALTPY
jgi:hypothetical protein